MVLDWNEYHKELGSTMAKIAGINPELLKGYQTLSGAGAKTGKRDEKTRQLIALAVAVTIRCDG
jgi:alkylhydroperoxidase/carboxymuconolactone decarboxylase family protein YurZ